MVKCEWCNKPLRRLDPKCPFCGMANANKHAKENTIIDTMKSHELITRISNLGRTNPDEVKLDCMDKTDLIALYREMKKNKQRCE